MQRELMKESMGVVHHKARSKQYMDSKGGAEDVVSLESPQKSPTPSGDEDTEGGGKGGPMAVTAGKSDEHADGGDNQDGVAVQVPESE